MQESLIYLIRMAKTSAASSRLSNHKIGINLGKRSINFQQSEFLLEHGALDMIIDRREMRDKSGRLMAKLTNQNISSGNVTQSNDK